jgi:CheY-like chemotaxis protein
MKDDRAPAKKFRLLYVEDNPVDVSLVREALRECCPEVSMTTVDRGDRALAYLRQEGDYAHALRPHLVLLDLNLPVLSGEEVLLAIKSDRNLKAMPVVVFTSAANVHMCKSVYYENANTCIQKPHDWDGFLHTVELTCRYWSSVANLWPVDGSRS